MKISIITPSYNSGKFIKKNILSVLNQNYQNFEHLIQDNNSDDNTHKILNNYSHLKTFIERDKGQSDALNKLLKKTSGDIIGWLNADEYYNKKIFKKIVDFFKQNPDVDAIYGNLNLIDNNFRYIRTLYPLKYNKYWLPYSCIIPPATFFIRSKVLKKFKIKFNNNFFYKMDQEFFCKLSKINARIIKIDIKISNFIIHDKAKTAFKINNISKKKFNYEGIKIINKFGFFKIPENSLGIFILIFLESFQKLLSFIIKKIYKFS